MTGLQISDVSLLHGDGEDTVTALDHVSIDVAPGEFVASSARPARASPRCWPSPVASPPPPRAR